MTRHLQKESLGNALYCLQRLHLEYSDAIELKTLEIQNHNARKDTVGPADSRTPDEARKMQAWRRISFQLHQRRSQLKTMKESLVRQIDDVETALEQMENLCGLKRLNAMDMVHGMGEAVA